MRDPSTPPPSRRFTLRTILFWVMPYCGICFLVMTAFRNPMTHPGEGMPLLHWWRFVGLGIVTVLWVVLFREDQRALRLPNVDRDPDARTKA